MDVGDQRAAKANQVFTTPTTPPRLSSSPFNSGSFGDTDTNNRKPSMPDLPAPPPCQSWSYNEAKKRKRVAKYKSYSVEGKVKNSLRNGFRWIKKKCSKILDGF